MSISLSVISSITGTPRDSALICFDPPPSPERRKSVFEEIEPLTFPPFFSISFLNSCLETERVPVITKVFRVNGSLSVIAVGSDTKLSDFGSIPSSRSFSKTVFPASDRKKVRRC